MNHYHKSPRKASAFGEKIHPLVIFSCPLLTYQPKFIDKVIGKRVNIRDHVYIEFGAIAYMYI